VPSGLTVETAAAVEGARSAGAELRVAARGPPAARDGVARLNAGEAVMEAARWRTRSPAASRAPRQASRSPTGTRGYFVLFSRFLHQR